jgi:hypothetical protein
MERSVNLAAKFLASSIPWQGARELEWWSNGVMIEDETHYSITPLLQCPLFRFGARPDEQTQHDAGHQSAQMRGHADLRGG